MINPNFGFDIPFKTQIKNNGSKSKINSDYEAKRSHDITLQRLEIMTARENLFDDWLKGKGKLGGQHKIPRLANDRKIIDEIIQLNQ